jgi:hypothetical protein
MCLLDCMVGMTTTPSLLLRLIEDHNGGLLLLLLLLRLVFQSIKQHLTMSMDHLGNDTGLSRLHDEALMIYTPPLLNG